MARTILGSIWDRGNRNELNRMLGEIYGGVDRVTTDKGISTNLLADGAVNERTLNTFVNNRIYNANYQVGVNIGNAYDNGNFLDLYINDLRIFISSGTTLFSITNQEFRLERNTTLYIDMAATTPTIVKGSAPPQSGVEFGAGGFFDDRKILLLSNAYGTLMGVLADSFKNAVTRTLDEKVLAKKEGDNYLVYVQSTANPKRYTQYLIEHKEIAYAPGDKYSNVKVNTLNGAKAVTRNMDNTFTSGTDLVHGGAWDVAIREANVSDGVGGIAHGDELQNFFKVKTNGNNADISTTLTHYQSVEFVAGSELFRDSQTFTDLQKLATHYKSFYFTGDGLIMDSNVKFLREATLNYMYLGMCPINKQFTDKAYSDIDVVENDLTGTAPIHTEKQNVNNISVYGATASVDVQVLERQTDLNENTRIEEVSYNKIYFDLADNNEVAKEGNVYRLKTKFEITLL